MVLKTRLASSGAILIAIGVLLILFENSLWWPFVIVGGLLFMGSLNLERPESIWHRLLGSRQKLFRLALVYFLIGFGQEGVGRLIGIWTYEGVYASVWVQAALVLLGYPLFLALVSETHVALQHTPLPAWAVWITNISFLVGWSELPNLLAPLYQVNPPYTQYQIVIFTVGYILQAVLAVLARRLLL